MEHSILIVLFCTIVTSQTIDQIVYKNEGEVVTLVCQLTRAGVQVLQWSGPPNNQPFFQNTDKNPNAKRADRLSVVDNPVTGGYNLVITGVTRADDVGLYNCAIVGTQMVYTIRLSLYVVPNDITIIGTVIEDGTLRIKGNESSTLLLTCQSLNGDPPADVTWYRGSRTLTTGKNQAVYSLTPTRSDDLQDFKCASDSAALTTPKESTVQLYLNLKPYPPIIGDLPTTKDGQTLVAKCNSAGSRPPATLLWEFHRQLSPASSSAVNDSRTQTFNVTSTSQIYVQKQDNGQMLTCKAKNVVGVTQSTKKVNVTFGPTSVSFEGINDLKENFTLNLKCTSSESNKIPVFSWTNNSATLTVSSNSTTTPGDYNGVIASQVFTKTLSRHDNKSKLTCTASNDDITANQSTMLNVKYSPVVSISPSNLTVKEGQTSVRLQCNLVEANPTDVTYTWIPAILPSSAVYTIPTVKKSHDGEYKCSASNSVGTSPYAVVAVIVNYPPEIQNGEPVTVDENESVTLSRTIDSKPPVSTVTWTRNDVLLNSVTSSQKTTYTIKTAQCTDTGNYTITASNGIPSDDRLMVELRVNCKPRISFENSENNNFTLGVSDGTGIHWNRTFIAYPKPSINLTYSNSTPASHFTLTLLEHSVNNFSIIINKSSVEEVDYTSYKLVVTNSRGTEIIHINITAQRKPFPPEMENPICEKSTSAIVRWISSFDGGDTQLFRVIVSNFDGQEYETTSTIKDKGKGKLHSETVEKLQPSTLYFFNVSARNKHGITYSSLVYNCTTQVSSAVPSTNNAPVIAGIAASCGLLAAIIAIAVVILFKRRHSLIEKQSSKSNSRAQLNENQTENTTDDGLKDNALYISAGPRNDELPGASSVGDVYSQVKKSGAQKENNNVYAVVDKAKPNVKMEGPVYADVVKPKKGVKKEKGKKGKKDKQKKQEHDVYENSEDIALKESYRQKEPQQRGYKNKDGLLYVDVQFENKPNDQKPIIHGVEDRNDYATVAFEFQIQADGETAKMFKCQETQQDKTE